MENLIMTDKQVHTTTDYFLFKNIEGNRNLNTHQLDKLRVSMQERYLFTIVVVNENYEIIDGMHRFTIIKELGFPLHYVICKGYGLNEVHMLNRVAKTWNSSDFVDGYAKLGYNDYIKFRDFRKKYGFGHNESIALLSGNGYIKSSGFNFKVFNSGNFKIYNYKNACDVADAIIKIGEFYSGNKRRSFVFAMQTLMNNPNFDIDEFFKKLSIQPTALVNCTNREQYISLIEDIYNFRRANKINLRFNTI